VLSSTYSQRRAEHNGLQQTTSKPTSNTACQVRPLGQCLDCCMAKVLMCHLLQSSPRYASVLVASGRSQPAVLTCLPCNSHNAAYNGRRVQCEAHTHMHHEKCDAQCPCKDWIDATVHGVQRLPSVASLATLGNRCTPCTVASIQSLLQPWYTCCGHHTNTGMRAKIMMKLVNEVIHFVLLRSTHVMLVTVQCKPYNNTYCMQSTQPLF